LTTCRLAARARRDGRPKTDATVADGRMVGQARSARGRCIGLDGPAAARNTHTLFPGQDLERWPPLNPTCHLRSIDIRRDFDPVRPYDEGEQISSIERRVNLKDSVDGPNTHRRSGRRPGGDRVFGRSVGTNRIAKAALVPEMDARLDRSNSSLAVHAVDLGPSNDWGDQLRRAAAPAALPC